MCGIIGWSNHNGLTNKKRIFKKMVNTLKRRGPDSSGYMFTDNVYLGHRRLAIIDPQNGLQPYTYKNYTIIYNGELYNTQELKNDLIKLNYKFETNCDTEVLLKGYVHYKEKILDKINGIFSFAIYDNKKLFIARDRVGVKPLYYYKKEDNFIFSSNIKGILKSGVDAILDKESLQILLGLSPSIPSSSGIFKDIKQLKPGYYMILKSNKLTIKRYWRLKDKECKDTYDEAVVKVREMVTSIVEKQLVSDVPLATLLSGGLDSSIITAIAASKKDLKTYSIDYKDNMKHFKKNDYQVSTDKEFIKIMSEKFNTNHSYKVISNKTLASYLKKAVIAKDLPGMADIDSSLLWFSKQISKEHKVILSGECADEIFGGYPWFYKKSEYFPWIKNVDMRENLIKKELKKILNIKDYIIEQFEKSKIKNKNIFHINMNWFMDTLLTRKDRMTMYNSLEARVPFADHNLIEYLWNLPVEYKIKDGVEKKLLRDAFKDLLPDEIINRKKNPYPKTHNPIYYKYVCNLLKKSLKNKKSLLHQIFDIEEVYKIMDEKDFDVPWFGQLMTKPQLIAYLYQIHYWGLKYKIKINLS